MDKSSMHDEIDKTVKENPVVLYIKGAPGMPMCGFSKAVMDIFDRMKVEYKTIDVLSSPEIREGIKLYTSWPTIPQVFIRGEFIGGCDIVREMHAKGELQSLVNKNTK